MKPNENQTRVIRRRLERAGERLVARLLQANRPYVGTADEIATRLGISISTLRRLRAEGRVIYSRAKGGAEDLYPLEQFAAGATHSWAAEVIATVGNGAPAIHFLYVARRSLGDRSFAELLRGDAAGVVPSLVRKALGKLIAGENCARKHQQTSSGPHSLRTLGLPKSPASEC
jgi:hypothetical protein